MKANEFVKKYGWEYVTNIVKNWNQKNPYLVVSVDNCTTIHIDDLKRLVEAHDLVMEHGSIERAKKYADSPYTAPEIKAVLGKAISDVESCQ